MVCFIKAQERPKCITLGRQLFNTSSSYETKGGATTGNPEKHKIPLRVTPETMTGSKNSIKTGRKGQNAETENDIKNCQTQMLTAATGETGGSHTSSPNKSANRAKSTNTPNQD